MPSTRRAFLATVAAGGVAVSGCSSITGSPTPDDPPAAGVENLPSPDDHIFGANGEWSSFGCNAANTREVADGKAPVDGVSERWRVEIPQLSYRAPVVAGGRVYQLAGSELRVLETAEGAEQWSLADARTVPLVRDGVAYVSTGSAVRALDAETGDRLWNRQFETEGRVTTPATYGGDELVCGAGEQVIGLDAETSEVLWRRDVFGQVLHHAAFFAGHSIVVATEAGMVYLLGDEGKGRWQWQLPAPPACPPSAGTDSVYVNCRDGKTYALITDWGADMSVSWSAETGWADRGVALADRLVVVANGQELHAIDGESGAHRWTYGIGDWRHTAAAYGRDTLFVGGDRLRALDPTPGGNASDSPALRFEQEFDGRVGPGPVLDDGTIYVVAQTEPETYSLLALE